MRSEINSPAVDSLTRHPPPKPPSRRKSWAARRVPKTGNVSPAARVNTLSRLFSRRAIRYRNGTGCSPLVSIISPEDAFVVLIAAPRLHETKVLVVQIVGEIRFAPLLVLFEPRAINLPFRPSLLRLQGADVRVTGAAAAEGYGHRPRKHLAAVTFEPYTLWTPAVDLPVRNFVVTFLAFDHAHRNAS